MQGLCLDGHAALPLALLLLSQSCPGAGERLDERDLSTLGRRARRDPRDAGLLVQAPAVLKLMIDRLVCADGGNPDPTSTHGKKAEEAEALELRAGPIRATWQDRVFGVVVHGDTEGADTLRRVPERLADRHGADCRPASMPPSIATSATRNRTRRATTPSIGTPRSSRRCGTSPVSSSRR